MRRRHEIPHLVVLALGADASITAGQIQQAKKILGPKRKLGLVTPRELGGGESNDTKVIRNAGQRDPERCSTGSTTPPGTAAGSSPTGCTSPSARRRRLRGS
jgi:hypothetical protein